MPLHNDHIELIRQSNRQKQTITDKMAEIEEKNEEILTLNGRIENKDNLIEKNLEELEKRKTIIATLESTLAENKRKEEMLRDELMSKEREIAGNKTKMKELLGIKSL